MEGERRKIHMSLAQVYLHPRAPLKQSEGNIGKEI
jgi:hypothetical protein